MDSAVFKCESCGKPIIRRLQNGLWHFCFGRNPNNPAKLPVEMLIYGSVQMRCLRTSCNNIITLNYFPFQEGVFENRFWQERQAEIERNIPPEQRIASQ